MSRLVALALLASAAVLGQTNRGSISGTVTDPSGGAVPGAAIKVTNLGTNEVRNTTSSSAGSFTVTDIEPVKYKLEVSAPGFKVAVVNEIKVDTATVASVAIKLETGSVETKVTVQAQAVMVNTDSGTLSSTITERQIDDAPLLNRSVLDLALTLPNVAGDAGSEDPVLVSVTPCPGCNLTIGGGRPLQFLDPGRRQQQHRRQPRAHHRQLHPRDGPGIHRADREFFR